MIKGLFVVVGAFLVAGCAIRNNLETPFNNASNTPVVHDGSGDGNGQIKYCVPDANGNYDGKAIAVQSGLNADSSAWAQGGGCVLRPIREVWAVINNLEEMKFDAADRFTATRQINPKSDFTHLYTITYYKSTPIGAINWTIEWYHGIGSGNFTAPQSVNINYQRTKGTPFIPIWHGGIVLTKVTDTVTSVAIRNEFRASQSDAENVGSAQDALNEMIGHMRTGPPDWSRLNTGLKGNPNQPDPPAAPTPSVKSAE